MANKVYLLEDDASICDLVKCTLDLSGIDCECFTTVKDFNAALEKGAPDVALIDVALPEGDGLDVLKHLKMRCPETSAIMLSALAKETDKVKGLNAGADDYIAKPFGILELTARVNVALRHSRKSAVLSKSSLLKVGSLEIDTEKMTATYKGKKLSLTHKEYQLLRYCAANKGKVMTREALLNDVWGYDYGETRTLDNHIARLRKLGLNFETVFGVGYKFIVD